MRSLSAIDRRHSKSKPSLGRGLRTMLQSKISPTSQMPPSFRNALHLLDISDLNSFESHVLGLEAFLKPWCYYRDNFLLLASPGRDSIASRSTKANTDDASINKRDILHFYTTFYLGEMRFDARCDPNSSQYTEDRTKYGTFSTTHWRATDYEKMLSAWLLQEFRVGKLRNPFGFKYFELKNICSAWEEVIQPIIAAVRDSYDVRGRRFYGRLALFIEDRCPSGLAFPEGNSTGVVLESALKTPYRRDFVSKGMISGDFWSESMIPRGISLTERDIAKVDTELKDMTDKYSGRIERPKFKARVEDWLATQRERHSIRKENCAEMRGPHEKYEEHESPMFGCKGIVDDSEPPSQEFHSLSPTASGYKGILHLFDAPDASNFDKHSINKAFIAEENQPLAKPVAPFAKSGPQRQSSDGVYTSIRKTNPFSSEEQDYSSNFDPFIDHRPFEQIKQYDILSPIDHGPPSAIPKPLFNQNVPRRHTPIGENIIPERSPISGSYPTSPRYPSYAGNGYDREITPGFIAHKHHPTVGYDPNAENNKQSQPSYIPGPATARHLSSERQHFPQHPHWADKYPSTQTELQIDSSSPIPNKFCQLEVYDSPSEYEASIFPPIPARNPLRSEAQTERPPPGKVLGGRIISKENIRAHLDITRDSLCVDLSKVHEEDDGIVVGEDAAGPPKVPLMPYNTHMFPRKTRK